MFEATIAKALDNLGIVWEYEPISIPWIPEIQHYTPDFRITLPNGRVFYIEAKGYLDPVAKEKMEQVRHQYPKLDLEMLFMNPMLKIPRSKTTTYADWADKQGYPCCTIDSFSDMLTNPEGNNAKPNTKSKHSNSTGRLRQGNRPRSSTTSREAPINIPQLGNDNGGDARIDNGNVQTNNRKRQCKKRSIASSNDSHSSNSGQ